MAAAWRRGVIIIWQRRLTTADNMKSIKAPIRKRYPMLLVVRTMFLIFQLSAHLR